MKTHILILILPLTLFFQCNTTSETSIEIKNVSDVKCIPLKGQDINLDSIWSPIDFFKYNDYLIVQEMNTSKIFSLYNLKNNKYLGQFIHKGVGPGESIGPNILGLIGDKIKIFDLTLSKLIQLELKNNELINRSEIKINADPLRLINPKIVSNTTLVSNCISDDNTRLVQFNIEKNKFDALYSFALKPENNISYPIHNQAYHSLIEIKPDKSKVVMAGKNSDLFEIYDLNSRDSIILRTHNGINPQFELMDHQGIQVMGWVPSMPFCYTSLMVTDEFIYGLYSGRTLADGANPISTKIYVFNWFGKIIKGFELEYPSIKILQTTDHQFLSLELVDSEYKFRTYELPK